MIPYIFTGDIPEYRFPFCLTGGQSMTALCQFIACYGKPPTVLVVQHETTYQHNTISTNLPLLNECIAFDICTKDMTFLSPHNLRNGRLDGLFKHYDMIIFTTTSKISVGYFQLAARYQTLLVFGNDLRFSACDDFESASVWHQSPVGPISPTHYTCLSRQEMEMWSFLLADPDPNKLWISDYSPFAYKEF